MKRFVTGVILTSALAVSLPVVTPGLVHAAEAAKPAAVNVKTVAAAPVNVLAGFSSTPRWIGASTLLVTHITEESKQDFTVQVPAGTYTPVVGGTSDAADLVVSPDGKYAAYTNDANLVFIVDLATHTAKQASEDKSYKADLQWSKDGSKLYFIQGDKANVIAQLTVADGKVSAVLDDKVNYKSDLQVSEDGSKLVYVVEKDGMLTADSVKENNVESVEQAKVELNLDGTEPQLFVFDTTVKDGKALQLTSKSDNKSFVTLLHNGRVAYVSADMEKENQPSVLKLVTLDGKETKDLLTDLNVLQNIGTPDGHLFVLAADKAGKKAVYQVDGASGVKVKKWDVPDATIQVVVSADAKQIAVTQATATGEKVAVLSGGKFVDVTK
ncbi:hypothetical protein EDM56_12405 [Brevibacillus fluminis]|uniref:Uncharacterized protein n=1 Tax=Brevibacillus fluminis TaxID=511487 RepID=A0A3M8DPC1_9BACL|nr:hypothetical protein [Brevibacillus fluminis]RNB89948.1 hypothetical protein EDM56_12405 [Brevibacillus fluminis]